VARVVRLVYDDGVWALVGSIDGAATHLAEQVVAKARLPLVSPVSTDGSVNLANVAWAFSCFPQDGAQATLLARAIAERVGSGPLALLSANDHDSHRAALLLEARLVALGVTPQLHVELEPGRADLDALVSTVVAARPAAVAILAGARESSTLVTALREGGFHRAVFGGPAMGRHAFLESAGAAAEGAVFPHLCDPRDGFDRLVERFEARAGRAPDCAAAQAYDAVRLVTRAIDSAGLNRARIRDAIRDLSPWVGAAGRVEWNPVGQNRRAPRLARIANGRVVSPP
jgi:ABC-type branched-subunit amino acid transport system substrate-binding protein